MKRTEIFSLFGKDEKGKTEALISYGLLVVSFSVIAIMLKYAVWI